MDLERGHAGERARRGTDLGGEVRQRREVVAEHRGGIGEPAARQLHPVPGVPGEADHDPLAFFYCLVHTCLTY